MTYREVWQDQNAPSIALIAVFVKKYGVEAFDWEPEIARQQIEEDYGKITDLQSDKLQAGIIVLTTNTFEIFWHIFTNICHAFSNIPGSFEDFDPLTPEEIIVGLAQIALIHHDSIEFDSEINAYVGLIFHEHGFSKPPDLFPMAIMPKGNESDDTEKNKALDELFKFHLERCADYCADID